MEIANKFKILILTLILFLISTTSIYAANRVILGPTYIPQDAAGRALAFADIYVGEPDTDPEVIGNQKQLYVLEEDGTTTIVSQPITTGAGGVPLYNGDPVTLFVYGAYSLKILNSSGSQVYYVPNDRTPDIDGTLVLLSDYDDLADAVSKISSTPTELWIDEDATMDENVTAPTTLTLKRLPGHIITTTGYTLTINGDYHAGLFDGFDGTGSVVFGSNSVSDINLAWFGTDSTAFEEAIESSVASTKPVRIPPGSLDLEGADLDISGKLWLIGDGENSIITDGYRLNVFGDVEIRGVNFTNFRYGSGSDQGRMLYIRTDHEDGDDIDEVIITDSYFSCTAGSIDAIAVIANETAPTTGSISHLEVRNCKFENVMSGLFLRTPITQGVIENNRFINIDSTNAGEYSVFEAYGIIIGRNFGETITWDSPYTTGVHILNNYFNDIEAGSNKETHAVIVYGTDHKVNFNHIEDINGGDADCEAIYLRGSRNEAIGNTIIDGNGDDLGDGDAAITVKSEPTGRGTIIANNNIYFVNSGANGAIHARDTEGGGIIRGNVIYAASTKRVDLAIETYGGWRIEGNTLVLLSQSDGISVSHDPTAGAITGATNASPIVINETGHRWTTGLNLRISGVGGNTAANGEWRITKVDANSYSLDGSTGNGAYTSGGEAHDISYQIQCAVVDNFVYTENGTGIRAGYSVDTLIDNNYINVLLGWGIKLETSGSSLTTDPTYYSDRATVSNNKVLSEDETGKAVIFAWRPQDILIQGNRTFADNTHHIYVMGQGQVCTAKIIGNTMEMNPYASTTASNTYCAIKVDEPSQEAIIIDNTIQGTYTSSGSRYPVQIQATKMLVKDNSFDFTSDDYGIYVHGANITTAIFDDNLFGTAIGSNCIDFQAGYTITNVVINDNSNLSGQTLYDLNGITPTNSDYSNNVNL